MPIVQPDRLINLPVSPSMNYPTVPIEDVPVSGPFDKAEDYRPMVMVVDSESATADTMSEILIQCGYAAIAAYDGESALETALLTPPELAIIDVELPGMSGIELAIALKSCLLDCEILLLSEPSAARTLRTSADLAGYGFELLYRPVRPDVLLERVSSTFNSRRAHHAAGAATR